MLTVILADRIPSPDAVRALAKNSHAFSISHDAGSNSDQAPWFELLHMGLTFDLSGWASPVAAVDVAHHFDVEQSKVSEYKGLSVSAGPHLKSAETMLPVLRGLMGLMLELTHLDGVKAVQWLPARSVMSVEYFSRVVSRWLAGGVFPGLGLVSLVDGHENMVRTEGLAFFGKPELEFETSRFEGKLEVARLAVRLIDELVERPIVEEELTLQDGSGGLLLLSPHYGDERLRVLR